MEQLFRLRRFLNAPPPAKTKAAGCELCGAPFDGRHSHVIDVENRRLLCTCRPCYFLFMHSGAAGGKFRSVSERVLKLPDIAVSGSHWDALDIPVGILFLLRHSSRQRVTAFYPSPAGATESGLPMETWDEMAAANPLLGTIEPDIEALLICRHRKRMEAWIVPVDACYELVGRIRQHWKGFDGSPEAWNEIDEFFDRLREREGELRLTDLGFTVLDARAEPHAAVPTLVFRVRIQAKAGQAVHAILLRCLIQIEPRRRSHGPSEQERLTDVFGEPDRWRDTLRPLVWNRASITVPAFETAIEIDVPVACTYDFEVTAPKYLDALEGGDVPLLFLFSGTVFAKAENGFRVEQVAWDKESAYRMPVEVWRDLMDAYFPGCAWIRIQRESLDALQRFRARNGFLSWDETIKALVGPKGAPAP